MGLKKKDYVFVGIQFLLFVLYLFDFRFLKLFFPQFLKDAALVFTIIGAVIIFMAMLQLNRNLSPFPTPRSGARLVKTGLFNYVRHPIYGGILLTLSSYSIHSASGFRVLICLGLYALFYLKTEYEEMLLEKKYLEYSAYRARTGRFFPKIK